MPNKVFAFEKNFVNSVPSLTLSFFFFFVLQVRRRFCFSRIPSTGGNNVTNVKARPPAPLSTFPPEYAPDDSYEDLDSVNRSREGSVISLEWPYPYNEIRARSTNKQTITPMNGRKPSNGPAHVMPPTQTLPPSSDRAKKPPFDITGAQLSQIKEIRASNLLAAYQPQSPTSRVIPHANESEYDDCSPQLHDNEPPEVPENQSSSFKNRSSHEHPTLTTKNPLYVETFKPSDYGNLPPPLPEPRKDADVYMSPLTLPQRPISDCIDDYGYLKCIV